MGTKNALQNHLNVNNQHFQTCNLYMQPLETTLYPHMKQQWLDWIKSSPGKKYKDLYVVLICDARSVLFVMHDDLDTVRVVLKLRLLNYNANKSCFFFFFQVTLIDSHQHTNDKGAVIAMVSRPRLKCLCQWFGRLINACYQSSPELYELSCLYFKKKNKCKS